MTQLDNEEIYGEIFPEPTQQHQTGTMKIIKPIFQWADDDTGLSLDEQSEREQKDNETTSAA